MNPANRDTLRPEEKILFSLRSLYAQNGYTQYRMSKFEEYDLYASNKEFLLSDSVITFTDTNGKLMALKPDVTLSIVRNCRNTCDRTRKLWYTENVYRVSGSTNGYREIMQTGLECIGTVDDYNLCEVVRLAAESLRSVSDTALLAISHLDIVSAFIDRMHVSDGTRRSLLSCIRRKSTHELAALCPDQSADLIRLLSLRGSPEEAFTVLEELNAPAEAVRQLRVIFDALSLYGLSDSVRFDFSVISDTEYYNGVVFKGYVGGIPEAILSGGRYDRLLARMNVNAEAIGFAVYLDLIERYMAAEDGFDTDILLLYTAEDNPVRVASAVRALTADGYSVLASRDIPDMLKYRRKAIMEGNGVKFIGPDA